MAINTFPAVASPVKSVQRGSAGGAGTVTITAIDISKSMVNVFGTASSGTVAATGAISAANGVTNTGQFLGRTYNNNTFNAPISGPGAVTGVNLWSPALNLTMNTQNLSGGTTNLVSAVVQGYLSNSTSLVVSAACRYEVVEFN